MARDSKTRLAPGNPRIHWGEIDGISATSRENMEFVCLR